MNRVRVRFAPSPTGSLHIGGARTAVFNWLYAQHTGGDFVLRIEDTDAERSRGELVQAILDDLRWLGMESDEPIVYQSDRVEIYRRLADELVERGAAYRDSTSPEELEHLRTQARARGEISFQFRADRAKLREVEANSEPYAIRFLAPDDDIVFADDVHGEVRFRGSTLDDFVLLRRDGSPTYHLSVVADDHDMDITDVIRGDDHISNTPKQLLIYRAMSWPPPRFAHVPLILGPDKRRLSKRHGATSVGEYREKGYLPEAVFNFIALLGWSPGRGDKEILTRRELVELFSTEGIHTGSAVFDESKLVWMNGEYLRELPAAELTKGLQPYLDSSVDAAYLEKVAVLLRPRLRMTSGIGELGDYFFHDPEQWDEKGRAQYWADPDLPQRLAQYMEDLEARDDFRAESLEADLRAHCETWGISAAKMIHPLRLALTGRIASPGLFEVMEVLGKPAVLRRLKRVLAEL
ncbi:MAG: glutamate--tRNA ligase [bacterium]